MLLYYPMATVIGFGIIIFVIWISLLFNVTYYAIFILSTIFLYANQRFILIVCGLFMISFFTGRLQANKITLSIPYPVLFALLLGSGVLGVYKSWDLDMGRYIFQFTLLLPIVIFMIYFNLKPSTKDIKKQLAVICLYAAAIGYISLIRYFLIGWTRLIVGFNTSNPAACFFGMILPFAIVSLIDSKENWEKILYWIVILGIAAGIFVTQSRAVYFTSIISIFYIAWKDRRVLKVMAPVIILGILVVPTLVTYRLLLMFGIGGDTDWSSVGRVQIWINTLFLIPEYFMWGMGIDSFRIIYPLNFPLSIIRAEHPHNVYLRWLFEFGIIGVSAYLLIIVSVFKSAFREIKKIKRDNWSQENRLLMGLNAGFLSALLAATVDSPFHHPQVAIFFWMVIAFQIIIVGRINRVNCGQA